MNHSETTVGFQKWVTWEGKALKMKIVSSVDTDVLSKSQIALETFSGDHSFRVHVPLTWRGIGGPQRAHWRFLGFGTWFKGTAAMSWHLCDDFLGNSDVILDTGHRCILCENTRTFSQKTIKKKAYDYGQILSRFCILDRFLPFGVTGRVHIWAKAGYTHGWVAFTLLNGTSTVLWRCSGTCGLKYKILIYKMTHTHS